MEIDESALNGLIEQSRDTHADAQRAAREPLADLVDLGRQTRAGSGPDADENRAFAGENRRRLASVAKRAGGLLAATGLIGAIADYIGSPAFAASGTDVQVLQTASSIEVLAVSTYKTALGLPYIGGSSANPVVKAFATTTMAQHADHLAAFQAATTALGGTKQTKPDPAFVPVVNKAVAAITKASPSAGALDVVALALELENIAAETYVNNMSLLSDANAKKLTASVMGVEAQHVAILLAVQALLKGGAGADITLPPPVAKLPAAAGSVGFPNAFYPTTNAAPASQGAM
ncbi:MAG TPA: ferritin-like domain-containing protein [Trebonia sp.]|nr:ferritin-like domain-containing protein [Trebonia sp.]